MKTMDSVSIVSKKGAVRRTKDLKFQERKDKSIYVKMISKVVGKTKSEIEEMVKTVHPAIERVFFPRQKIPGFFFVLCSSPDEKDAVWSSIKKCKNKELGPLCPKLIDAKPKRAKKDNDLRKTAIDTKTLVLEAVPAELSIEDIQAQFPKCRKAYRFNPRRSYLSFNSLEDAFEAHEKITAEPLCGFKIIVKFKKVKKSTKKGKKSKF